MKKKQWIIGISVIILFGSVGLFIFKQNEKERKEQEVLKMEAVTAKQIKNTFANVTKIEFSEGYVDNTLAGFTSIDVTIYTNDGVVATIGATMFLNNNAKNLSSYIGGTEFKKGITGNKITVIFSDRTEVTL